MACAMSVVNLCVLAVHWRHNVGFVGGIEGAAIWSTGGFVFLFSSGPAVAQLSLSRLILVVLDSCLRPMSLWLLQRRSWP